MYHLICDIIWISLFGFFPLVTVLFFMVVYLSKTIFLVIVYFVLFGAWFFFLDNIATVIPYMSNIDAVLKFWYIHSTFFPSRPPLCACIYRKSCRYPCIGILCKNIFHILLNYPPPDCTFIISLFSKTLSQILLIFRWYIFPFNLYSIFSMMFLYDWELFYRILFIDK